MRRGPHSILLIVGLVYSWIPVAAQTYFPPNFSQWETTLAQHTVRIDYLEKRVDKLEGPTGQKPVTPIYNPSPSVGSYVVQPGDYLSVIAARYGVSVSALRKANGLTTDQLYVGQSLVIPSGGGGAPVEAPPSGGYTTHRIVRGDTLSGLARRYGTSVSAIQSANRLSSPNAIREGNTLRIPSSSVPVSNPGTQPPPPPPPPPPSGGSITHTLASGETIYGLSRRYGVSVNSIMAANNNPNPNAMRIGTRLVIPGASGGGAAPVKPKPVPPPQPKPPVTNPVPNPPPAQPPGPEPSMFYHVAPGETADSVARGFNIPVSKLLQMNGFTSTSQIRAGDRIRVPADAFSGSLGNPY
jgi:LysM repeat protein